MPIQRPDFHDDPPHNKFAWPYYPDAERQFSEGLITFDELNEVATGWAYQLFVSDNTNGWSAGRAKTGNDSSASYGFQGSNPLGMYWVPEYMGGDACQEIHTYKLRDYGADSQLMSGYTVNSGGIIQIDDAFSRPFGSFGSFVRQGTKIIFNQRSQEFGRRAMQLLRTANWYQIVDGVPVQPTEPISNWSSIDWPELVCIFDYVDEDNWHGVGWKPVFHYSRDEYAAIHNPASSIGNGVISDIWWQGGGVVEDAKITFYSVKDGVESQLGHWYNLGYGGDLQSGRGSGVQSHGPTMPEPHKMGMMYVGKNCWRLFNASERSSELLGLLPWSSASPFYINLSGFQFADTIAHGGDRCGLWLRGGDSDWCISMEAVEIRRLYNRRNSSGDFLWPNQYFSPEHTGWLSMYGTVDWNDDPPYQPEQIDNEQPLPEDRNDFWNPYATEPERCHEPGIPNNLCHALTERRKIELTISGATEPEETYEVGLGGGWTIERPNWFYGLDWSSINGTHELEHLGWTSEINGSGVSNGAPWVLDRKIHTWTLPSNVIRHDWTDFLTIPNVDYWTVFTLSRLYAYPERFIRVENNVQKKAYLGWVFYFEFLEKTRVSSVTAPTTYQELLDDMMVGDGVSRLVASKISVGHLNTNLDVVPNTYQTDPWEDEWVASETALEAGMQWLLDSDLRPYLTPQPNYRKGPIHPNMHTGIHASKPMGHNSTPAATVLTEDFTKGDNLGQSIQGYPWHLDVATVDVNMGFIAAAPDPLPFHTGVKATDEHGWE